MKKMRRLIPAIAMLLVSAVMLSTASFAWFTMSTSATADGMTVKAQASSSLLITTENNTNGFTVASGVVEFEDEAKALIPATHYDSTKHGTVSTDTNLVTVDSSKVVAATGGYTGTYSEAENAGTTLYYTDYVVFIGASGAEIANQDLTVTISLDSDLSYLLHNAVSIDFIVDKSTKDDSDTQPAQNEAFIQTVNLKTVDASTTPAANNLKITLASDITVPQALVAGTAGDAIEGSDQTTTGEATFNDSIKVIMRVYFDGALVQTEGATDAEDLYYVRNALAVTNAIGFAVKFDVVDHQA